MPLFDFLYDIFNNSDSHDAYQNDPDGYFNQNGYGNVTSQDIQSEMPRVLAASQGQAGDVNQGGLANFANSGNVTLPPPPSHEAYAAADDGGGLSGALETLDHYYTTVYNETNQYAEDNDFTQIDDRDTTVDNSVNQNIEAFGDVVQDFDNDIVSGDGAIAAGDNSQNNTGDGAVQAGDDIEGSVNTGTVGGSVTGDIRDSNVVGGDANGAVIDSELDDSFVGDNNTAAIDNDGSAIAFGEGDAINAENVNQGDGTLIDDVSTGGGDANFNTGSGDQAVVSDSTVNDSAVGQGNQVQANDFDVDIDDGGAASFGSGDAEGNNVEVDGPVDGNVQVATGDNNDQTALNDESVNVDDSFNDESVNTAINDSFNETTQVDASDDDGIDIDESFDDNQVDASDDDAIDVL